MPRTPIDDIVDEYNREEKLSGQDGLAGCFFWFIILCLIVLACGIINKLLEN